jgi:tetratricopeptide (TPR) repeat protein
VLASVLAPTPLVAQPAPPAPERCSDLASCRQALARGAYPVAEQGLEPLRRGGSRAEASVVLARVYLETGRYAEAAELVRPLARSGAVRIEAATLLGEAELARGRMDEAQQAFELVQNEAIAHRARVFLGRVLTLRGRSAQTPLMALIQAYNDGVIGERDGEGLAYVGMAADMLDSPQDANDAFREATRADPNRVETQLEWARLFLRKYDTGHAEESVQQALRTNPNSAVGHALLARIKLDQSLDFVGAQAELDRALAIDPNLVMAHVTRAGIAIRDMELAAAEQHLTRALSVCPSDLEALSVMAALRFLQEDRAGYQRAVREVLSRNPRYSAMYTIIADYADWEHRYPQIVEMAREALRLDPNDASAHATLGINLLRMGDEPNGLSALREAWRRDRFNVRVFNLLNLYDDVIAREYEDVQAAPFTFRIHRDERPVMERYLRTTLVGAYQDMRRRYGFTPRGPLRIEMYSNNQHFSVRTSGLPNIGVQGVCFGQVVTALSPRAGQFNWGQITWHELAHVFHIQMSQNRVPRWFTEGLAEYETVLARPEWRREEDYRLHAALAGNRLPPLRQLNHAFTHARSGEDVMTAYYASSMVVKYIAERFGFDRLAAMLRGWGEGRTTEDVVQRALGVSIDELDRDFRAHTTQRLAGRPAEYEVDLERYADLDAARARAQQSASDAAAQAELAASLLANGQGQEASAALQAALRLDPRQPMAHFVAARIAFARRDAAAAEPHLAALLEGGRDGYVIRIMQARAALARRDAAAARQALEAASRIDGERPEAWQGLLEIAEQGRDAELRFMALRRLAELDQHDRGSSFALLRMLAERDAWDEVLRFGEMSVFIDPLRAESRVLLAEAYLRANRGADALAEADTALAARPEAPGPVHMVRARALMALRRAREARQAAEAAVQADPSLADQARVVTGGR